MAKNRHRNYEGEHDPLRSDFTFWLDTTLYRARNKYLERHTQKLDTVSLDEIPADHIEDPTDCFARADHSKSEFDFEEEKLAKAFYDLSLMRREILRLLFVEEKKPKEIAILLHCSENYVHLQKSRALKKLRAVLIGGDDILD